MPARIFTTAGVNNLWSNALNWDGGLTIPADLDSFTIPAGQTCEFNVDQSLWTGMAASTIAATGTLIASTTAGAYVLKMAGDITLTGTLQAGTSVAVPYPSTCTFMINFSAGSNSIVVNDTTGRLYLYCVEPTLKYVSLTADAAAGAAVALSVDGNVTADWANGAKVAICDLIVPGASTRDNEETTISSTTSNSITIANLGANKVEGTVVVLIDRNIRLIQSTDYAVKNGNSCNIYAEIYDCIGGISGTDSSTIGGCLCIPASSTTPAINGPSYYCTYDFAIAHTGGQTVSAISAIYGCNVLPGSVIAGAYRGIITTRSTTISACIAGCNLGVSTAYSCILTSDAYLIGCALSITNSNEIIVYCDIANTDNAIDTSTNILVANAELGKSVGGETSNNCFSNCSTAKCYNTVFTATTEYENYASSDYRLSSSYSESFDHDGTDNAFKAWCMGGIITSATADPPTGYTVYYSHANEDADNPCFRQYEATVLPGTAIEVSAYIRLANGDDHTAFPPALQIIDKFADPLVDSTQSPLDEDEVAEPNGTTNSDWQYVEVIWANTGDAPRTVLVRLIAQHATGVVEEAWSVANYQSQINTILQKIKRLGPGGEIE
ncbi:MAG: hypothetical protein IMZ70_05675 [Candidatus Atribacteria bacterium]|nr:hypothetical protein [Candidatus Atribacteria bacterium]